MALYYELELLEELISITLHPQNLKNENSVKKQFNEWHRLILLEKEKIKKNLRNGLLSFEKEKQRALYVQQHQSALIHMQDTLHEYLGLTNAQKPSGNKVFANQVSVYQHFDKCLEELLLFIERNFPHYFNKEEKIPFSHTLTFQEKYLLQIKSLHRNLLQFSNDKTLNDLIKSILTNFLTKKRIITYNRLQYLKELIKKLESIENYKPFSCYPPLIEVLIELNFNAFGFRHYLLGFLKDEINAAGSLNDRLEKVCFHYKEINQLKTKAGKAFYPNATCIQRLVADYLQKELQFLDRKKSLVQTIPEAISKNEEGEEEGIHLLMSVEEIGLLTNIQKQAGLLKNTNMRSLAKLLASNHRSLRKDKLSWQNLYNCFSKVEMTTIASLDDKLITMVNTLRKIKSDLKNR
jgi:hypothetical protein